MRSAWKTAVIVFLAAAVAAAAGCGKGEKEDSAGDEESFRVPDSLLSPIESYNLTVDEYHPIKGGRMANADLELQYPPSEIARFVAVRTLGEAMEGYADVREKIGRPADGRVVIIGAKDLAEYEDETQKEWWYYGLIRGDTIYSEPFDIMLKRWDPVTRKTIARLGLTQRMAQMALDRISAGKIPVWMKEAAASYVADERAVLRMQVNQFASTMEVFDPTIDELESYIVSGNDIEMSRLSYFYVYLMLESLLERTEFSNVVAFARDLGKGATIEEACRRQFGMGYGELVKSVKPASFKEAAGPLPEPTAQKQEGHHH